MKPQGGSAAALAAYVDHAERLIDRYDAIPCDTWYAPVRHLFPEYPCRVIDIGAGTGRDARWFATMGHTVTAVEPVPAFVAHGQSLGNHRWIRDSLPELPRTLALGETFDLLTLSAVWQHLDKDERKVAAAAIRQLAAPGATILMALRHGPATEGRPVWPIDPDETAGLFIALGCIEIFRAAVPSIQSANILAGVDWTWMAFSNQNGELR